MRRILEIGGEEIPIWLAHTGKGYVIHVRDRAVPCALTPSQGRGAYVLELEGRSIPLRMAVSETATFIHLYGRAYEVGRIDPADWLVEEGAGAGKDSIVAPMPGVVVSVAVGAGDRVEKGQMLLVIESMKLETSLSAPRGGVVAELPFAPGQGFGLKSVLVRLAPEEE
ncbi:biotin/lipoyl-containing protein [uncultured Bradyrhizobium sp.]|uniref:biotin/lipoyl-containing protein n=1 Tax=uncultured Bradyrhizobium sp. TaxID=199684 RepID=UPI0026362818|nr:biotin/lipoyl-containing protein [uncultured Bradyrhizobium sp.]